MDTCPTCGRIGGALRPHLLLDSDELCPRGAPGDYPQEDPADLEGREEWGPEESNSGDPGEWADEPDEVPAPLPAPLPEMRAEFPEPPAPKVKRGRKAKAEPAPIVEDLLSRVAGDAFPMLCPVESCRSEVGATFDGERLVLEGHTNPTYRALCPSVVVPRKHWPPELTRAALERAGEWMVGEAADPGLASLFEPMTNVTGPGAVLTRETLKAGDAALRADADRGGDIVDADFDPDAAPIPDPAYQPTPLLTDASHIATPEPAPVAGTGDVWAEVEAFCDDLSEVSLSPADDIDAAWREHYAIRYPGSIASPSVRISKEVLMRGEVKPAEPWPVMDLGRGVIAAGDHESDATAVLAAELALSGILSALGVSDLNDAHRRIDAMRQAEKGLEQILTAAGEGATAVGVARELGRKPEPVTDETPPVEGVSFSGIITAVGGFEPTVTVTARVDVETCKAAGHLLYQSVRVVLPVEGEEP